VRLLRATTPRTMQSLSRKLKSRGKTLALVPTMGALHEGHLSLVRIARQAASRVLVSIFVNPKQFGPREDFSGYPRNLRRDLDLLLEAGVHAVYVPDANAMYPDGFRSRVVVDGLSTILEGASRPGHFDGVCTVVLKLLQAAEPDLMVLGQKDAQQCVVLERMIRDLDLPVKVKRGPTIREPDGLAISSRNSYLSAEERAQAPVLHRALQEGKRAALAGERDAARVREIVVRTVVAASKARLDYVEVVDPVTLTRLPKLQGQVLVVLACRFGRARLIDNLQFRVPAEGRRAR
jgi:pantoate--beta-alanine ligase